MDNKNKSIVPSLLTRCIDIVVFDIELYKNYLIHLPAHVKDNILKRINHNENLKYFFQNGYLNTIIHSQTRFLDLRTLVVGNDILEMIYICTGLYTLFLGQINTDEKRLINLFRHLPNLTNLELRNCNLVTDDLIQVIGDYCPYLVQLNIGGCKNISDTALLLLSKNCRHLKALDVSYSKITTTGIKHLVSKLGPQLTDLRLSNCNKITDEAIYTILESCSKIEMLLYVNCVNIKDESLSIDKRNSSLKQISWTISW